MKQQQPLNVWTRLLALVASFAITQVAVAADEAAAANEIRVSESKFYADNGREQRVPNRVVTNVLEIEDQKSATSTRGKAQQKLAATQSLTPNTDFWIYDADVQLFADDDFDGYFHGIDLLFDADTVFTDAQVYAVLYLSYEGGPWIEYAETDVFDIFGAQSGDEYVIETELLAGYPRGNYDILIELFDTFDGAFVADFGPENTSELALLPLEDAERDTPVTSPGSTVIVTQGGGGAIDWAALALLGVFAVGAGAVRRRHRLQLQPVLSARDDSSA